MKEQEFISAKQEEKEAEKFDWEHIFSGDFLTYRSVKKQLWFVGYVMILMMLYIGNQYRYDRIRKEYRGVKKEVSVLRAKSMELRADLMKYSRQSHVLRRVKDRKLGLELSSEPPVVLENRE